MGRPAARPVVFIHMPEAGMSLYWVTGAKGFIGQNLSRHLAKWGHSVVGLGHGHLTEQDLAANGLHGWLNSSVSASSLNLLLAQYGVPDVVFHLAGGSAVAPSLRAPYEDYERTVQSTAVLLEWLRLESPATAVVYVSSAAVYGADHIAPIAECSVPLPYSPYGFNKYCAELLIQQYACNFNLSASIVRLFSVYGPGLQKQLLWDVAQRLHAQPMRLELGGTGEEMRDWFFIDDAVELLLRASTWAANTVPVVNGATGVGTTVRDTVETLVRDLGCETLPVFTGNVRAGDPRFLVADTTCSDKLGFQARINLATGMQRTADWLKQAMAT
jgi:UDP-glucose 4-epimerase